MAKNDCQNRIFNTLTKYIKETVNEISTRFSDKVNIGIKENSIEVTFKSFSSAKSLQGKLNKVKDQLVKNTDIVNNKDRSVSIFINLNNRTLDEIMKSNEDINLTFENVNFKANKEERQKSKKEESLEKDNNLSQTEKFLKILKSRLDRLYNNAKNARTDNEKTSIANQIQDVTNEIELLSSEKNTDDIIKIGNKDLDRVEQILNKEVLTEQDFISIDNILHVYDNLDDFILNDKEKEGEVIFDESINKHIRVFTNLSDGIKVLKNRANILKSQIKPLKLNLFEKITNNYNIYGNIKDAIDNLKNINWLQANLLNPKNLGNIFLSTLEEIKRRSINIANLKNQTKQLEREEYFNKIKDNSLFKKDGWNLFAQEDEKGEKTGGLVQEYSSEYYNKLDNLKSKKRKAKTKEAFDKASKNLNDWYNENHLFIDTRKLFKNENEELRFPEEYLNELINKYKLLDEQVDNLFNDAISKYSNYLEDLRLEELRLEENESLLDIQKLEQVDIFKAKNDPNSKLENNEGAKIILGKHYFFEGFQYLTTKPARLVNSSKGLKDSGWYDKKFDTIKSDKDIYEYYKYINKTFKDLIHYLPESYLKEKSIKGNFIPYLSQSLLDKFNKDGTSSLLNGLSEFGRDIISENLKKEVSDIDIETGNNLFSLPIFMMDNKYKLVDGVKVLDLKDKSFDLNKVLEAFIQVQELYKAKSSVEDEFKFTNKIIKEVIETNSTENLSDELKGIKTKEDYLKILESASYINRAFYNNLHNVEGKSKKKIYSIEEKKYLDSLKEQYINLSNKQDDINAQLVEIKSILENGLDEEVLELEDNLKTKVEDINNKLNLIQEEGEKLGKNLTVSAPARSIMKWVQLKTQSWNVLSALNELLFGAYSAFNYGLGNEDFSIKHLNKATGIILNPTRKDSKKIKALMNQYNIVSEISELGKTSGNSWLSPFKIAHEVDYINKSKIFIATMLAKQVNLQDGSIINLWEAYDEEGNIKSEVTNSEDWKIKDYSNIEKATEYFKFKNKVDRINAIVNGDYNTTTNLRIKKDTIGQAASQFRTFLFEGFANRWSNSYYDQDLERQREGRYTTMFKIGQEFGVGTSIKLLFESILPILSNIGNTKFKDLPDYQQANIKRNLFALAMNLTVVSAILVLSAANEDDDDELLVLNLLINQVNRFQTDLLSYSNPLELQNLQKNLLPMFSLLKDIENVSNAFSKTIQGNSNYETGIYSGWNRIGKETLAASPYSSSGLKVYSSFKQLWNK